jgi:hypothetical protein
VRFMIYYARSLLALLLSNNCSAKQTDMFWSLLKFSISSPAARLSGTHNSCFHSDIAF